MNKIKTILLIIVFFVSLSQSDASTYIAGIDEAIDIAMKNSGELRAAEARFGVTEAQIFTANTPMNPVFIFDGGTGERTYRVGLQYILETGGKRKKRTLLARVQHEVTKDEINTKILDIKRNVRNCYIEVYAAQQREKYAKEMIEFADTLKKIEYKDPKTQVAVDDLQIETVIMNAEISMHTAHADVSPCRNKFNALMNYTLGHEFELGEPTLNTNLENLSSLTFEEHDLNLERLEKIAYENRPELKYYADSIEAAKRQLDVAKANLIPNVLLAAGPDFVQNNPPAWNSGGFLMAAIEIPIFDRQQGPIKEAIAAQNLSTSEYSWQKDQIQNDVKDAYTRVTALTQLIDRYNESLLARAQGLVDKALNDYNAGKSTIIVPLTAKETQINVQYSYIKALADYQSAVSDLERAIGTPL